MTKGPDQQIKARLSDADPLRGRFLRCYSPIEVSIVARVPPYDLPVALHKISNADSVKTLTNSLRARLEQNGFGAAPAGRWSDQVENFYEGLKTAGTPVFVTSDSLLHLYHIQFCETLRDIEEREFHKEALALTRSLYDASITQAQELTGLSREAALFNAAYFAVALQCLTTDGTANVITAAREHLTKASAREANRAIEQLQSRFPQAFDAIEPLRTPRHPWGKSLDDLDVPTAISLLDEAAKTLAVPNNATAALGSGLPSTEAENLRVLVAAELELIHRHEGVARSPLFQYEEDYSQYVPRGHYTRSSKLHSYFTALMWLGRMTALIKGGEGELVSAETARLQTAAGVLAAAWLDEVKLADGRTARTAWERIYAVTAFYVGFADDLTPDEYLGAARRALGERFSVDRIGDDAKFTALKVELAKLCGPAVYSGSGDAVGAPVGAVGDDDLLATLANTKGFRLMGQRYVPDSHMMAKLVYPTVGPWGGGEFAFTTVDSAAGPIRGFPRSLDVLAILGSNRAVDLLRAERDDHYVNAGEMKTYGEALADLRKEFDAVDPRQWNRNLYWSWLYCLKALLQNPGAGYPTFMQSVAWQDKQINAAAASWSQLRHDTILYAKQSYTMIAACMPQEPRMVEGYVEPVPEFYARVLALTRMTRKGLDEFRVLSSESAKRLDELEKIVGRLLDLSVKELANELLSPDDYDFIRNFGHRLAGVIAGIKTEGLQTSMIADVHTDLNSEQVLEEGTGNIRALWVIYPMPDGGLVLGCGPAFSYYEFKHRMADRLTDDTWRAMLRIGEPKAPAWTSSFVAP